MLSDFGPFSHRSDPRVPRFADEGLITVMDAQCGLCARGARWIARNDRDRAFRIIPLQSPLGGALMVHYGFDPEDPTSWLFLENGRLYSSLDAVIRVGLRLGGVWRGYAALSLVPKRLRDALYGLVARNRVKFMGTASFCDMPDPEIQSRLLR